jgi:sugar lactone lactonase YvrE
MTETFQCASCSGPLDFEGQPMQKCKFCGSTVIVPSELFHHDQFDMSLLAGRQIKIANIRTLIAQGQKLMAIKEFRETFGVGLAEAKTAVEAMERGMGVNLSSMGVHAPEIQIKAEDIKKIANVGVSVGKTMVKIALVMVLSSVAVFIAIFYFSYRMMNGTLVKLPTLPTIGSKNTTTPAGPLSEKMRIGGEGSGGGKFKDNRSVAVGPDAIYSVEYGGGQLQVFGADGQFKTQWEANRGLPVKDIAADRKGGVALLDAGGISVFEGATGKLIRRKDNYRAEGAAFAPDGKLVAAGRNGIAFFDPYLDQMRELKDSPDKAGAKFGFAKVAVAADGTIFATDRQNGDVCKFSADGKFVKRFPIGSASATAISVDPQGRIFVARSDNISVFDPVGRKLAAFPATQAYGIAIDGDGSLYVASRPFVVKYAVSL